MKTSPQQIIDDALQLTPDVRALIAETLLESQDIEADCEVSEQWRQELARRCSQIEAGAVTLIPADQVLAGLRAKYGQ